ncbi:polycomb group RING finger protein 3 [Culicoides brevitarsis]|uniref:polycomb group RING finger protein 3 n=1 Tax=Culicoides brevitarsis TaxID=469753 RepID=UPI00307BCEA7
MERKIKLKTLNSAITCQICQGYLIDATTVVECLHTFCKSCLVKHLEENNTCPSCLSIIHQSHPLNYISFDRSMQDIVYKLVPNLQEDEMNREREFYKERNLPNPKDIQQAHDNDENMDKINEEKHQESDYHRQDEQVNVCLECSSNNLKHLKRRFIRCSSQATITHLKKFVAKKVLNGMEKYRDIDILCNDELLGKDHTLKFVYVTRWRFKEPPLRLQYRPRIDL